MERPKGKRPLERHTQRREDEIDLKVIEWLGMYWINLKPYGDSGQVLTNVEISLVFYIVCRASLVAEELWVSEEGPCSI